MKLCCFCGHSSVSETLRAPLHEAIEKFIVHDEVERFYVGNHGEFDHMVCSELRSLKKDYPQISFYVILAYMPGKKEEFPAADPPMTIYPDGLESVPPRFAITHRNRWMVEQADRMIAYVGHGYGGAAQTLRYAQRKKLEVHNLADS